MGARLERAWIGVGIAVGASIAIAASFDLEISRSAARLGDRLGRIVQDYGTAPALVLYAVAIVLLAAPALRRRSEIVSRCASAALVQGLVHTMFFCNLLKLAWGRPRFEAVLGGRAAFAPIWAPDPGSGGMSFPSGHVATALVLLPVGLILARAGRRGAAAAILAGSAAYALVVAWARIRLGAHYLSDVLFSAATAVLMAPISVALGDRYLALFERASRRVARR